MKKRKVFLLLTVTALLCVLLGFSVSAAKNEKISLKAENDAKGVSLTWNCEAETTYTLFKKTGDGKFEKLLKIKGGKYTDKSVLSGTEYTYLVKKNSFTKSGKKTVIFLSPPKITSALNRSGGIKVQWNKVKGAETYTLSRKEQGGKWEKVLTSSKKTVFTDTNVKAGKRYAYYVRAESENAVSDKGNVIVAYRLISPKVTKIANTAQGVKILWNKTAAAKGYNVYRKGPDGNWTQIATVTGGDTLTYTDKTAVSGTKYAYTVKAVRGADKSQGVEGKKGILYLAQVDGLDLQQSGKKVELSWKAVKGAESYAVYKKSEGSKWKKVATVKKGTEFDYTLGTIAKTVYFTVKAVKNKTAGALSATVKTRRVDPNKPMVALTYDDGPHGTHTMKILSVLEKYDARATFFVVGSRIEYYPSCLEKAADIGCEVGNHTFGHISLSSSSKSKIESDISKTNSLIKKYTGNTATLARAPGGSVGKGLTLVNMPFIHWSIDTRDWESRNTSSVVSIVKRQVRDGSIVLMHDIYSSTASASEILIPWLISEGYQLVTVTEMMQARGVELKGGKVIYNGYR